MDISVSFDKEKYLFGQDEKFIAKIAINIDKPIDVNSIIVEYGSALFAKSDRLTLPMKNSLPDFEPIRIDDTNGKRHLEAGITELTFEFPVSNFPIGDREKGEVWLTPVISVKVDKNWSLFDGGYVCEVPIVPALESKIASIEDEAREKKDKEMNVDSVKITFPFSSPDYLGRNYVESAARENWSVRLIYNIQQFLPGGWSTRIILILLVGMPLFGIGFLEKYGHLDAGYGILIEILLLLFFVVKIGANFQAANILKNGIYKIEPALPDDQRKFMKEFDGNISTLFPTFSVVTPKGAMASFITYVQLRIDMSTTRGSGKSSATYNEVYTLGKAFSVTTKNSVTLEDIQPSITHEILYFMKNANFAEAIDATLEVDIRSPELPDYVARFDFISPGSLAYDNSEEDTDSEEK